MNAEIAAKPRRLGLYLPFALLMLVALGWTALWFYGRYRINLEIDNLFAREASVGRLWSCPERSITGYPFRIEGRCTNPTYKQEVSPGDVLDGSLKGLTIVATTAGALDLGHVISEFEGPLVVKRAGTIESTATWKTARSSIRGGIGRLERASLEIESPVVSLGLDGGGTFKWLAERISIHLREAPEGSAPSAYDLAIRLDKGQIPELDALMKSPDPVNLELDARILNLGTIDRRDWRRTVENWRTAGGTLRVEKLALAKGVPRAEARGDLRLDDQRRIEGRLDASFVNAGALLQQFGIGGNGGGAGGLLGALLGGGARAGDAQRQERAIRLPLVLENGRVAVGPFRIPGLQLRPVF